MYITLCSSASFFDRLHNLSQAIERQGYGVYLPSMKDYSATNYQENAFVKIQNNLIKEHFRKIDLSGAIYVANYDKNGISGYIGGNCFLEMGKAFDRDIPIFLMQPVPIEMSYRDELLALQPIVIGTDFNLLNTPLRNKL